MELLREVGGVRQKRFTSMNKSSERYKQIQTLNTKKGSVNCTISGNWPIFRGSLRKHSPSTIKIWHLNDIFTILHHPFLPSQRPGTLRSCATCKPFRKSPGQAVATVRQSSSGSSKASFLDADDPWMDGWLLGGCVGSPWIRWVWIRVCGLGGVLFVSVVRMVWYTSKAHVGGACAIIPWHVQ